MSSTMHVKLTEEQQKFLISVEEEFKDRYTENDEEFKAVLNEELPLPPIVENWGDFKRFDERFGNDRNYCDRDLNRSRYSYGQRRDDDSRYYCSSSSVHRSRKQSFPKYLRPY